MGKIDPSVGLMTLEVLVPILSTCDEEDDNERKDDETWGDGAELREELEDGDCGEETAFKGQLRRGNSRDNA